MQDFEKELQKANKKPEPEKMVGTMPSGPKKKLWEVREEFIREHGLTPRDYYERDWTEVRAPKMVMKNVRWRWDSDIERRRGAGNLRGFMPEIYQPVDDSVLKEFGAEVDSKDRSPEGWVRVGDACLTWAPESVAKEMDAFMRRGADVKKMMQTRKEEYRNDVKQTSRDTGPIGDVVVTKDQQELVSVEAAQRRELSKGLPQEE